MLGAEKMSGPISRAGTFQTGCMSGPSLGSLGMHPTRELENKPEKHFRESKQLLGIYPGHWLYCMRCFVPFLSNVINPGFSVGRNIITAIKICYIVYEGLTGWCSFCECDVHEQFPTSKD